MFKTSLLFLAVLGVGPATTPTVYTLSPTRLAEAKRGFRPDDPVVVQLYADAGKALQFAPVSVTQKKRIPPSGDRHDYYSQSPYWWPDPAEKDGLPFISRDGQTYPPSKQDTDSDNLWKLSQHVETLGLATYFSGRAEFAAHAARLVRVFLLDPATRMNPNLRFAQVIPGHTDRRGTGIIDARFLPNICNGVGLLRGSSAWTAEDDNAFNAWLAEYYSWLTTSAQGQSEHAAANNHGVWYLAQAAGIAARLGRTDDVRRFCAEAIVRIDRQIEPSGAQPLELARTRSLHYSLFTLEAFLQLAVLGETVGVDLWGHVGPKGQGLRAALAFLAPYVNPEKPWIKADVHPDPRTRLLPLVAQAHAHWPDAVFADALRDFGSQDGEREARWRLFLGESVTPPHQ